MGSQEALVEEHKGDLVEREHKGTTLGEWASRFGMRWRDMRGVTVAELLQLVRAYCRGKVDGRDE